MRSLFSLEGCAHVDDSQHVVLSTVANELVTCVGPSACATYYVTPVEKQTDFGRIVILLSVCIDFERGCILGFYRIENPGVRCMSRKSNKIQKSHIQLFHFKNVFVHILCSQNKYQLIVNVRVFSEINMNQQIKQLDLGKTKSYNRRQKKLGCSLKQKEVQKIS
jgi:hypothetical protein